MFIQAGGCWRACRADSEGVNTVANNCVERMGTSRPARFRIGRLWQLVPAAHARR
jgi:hypothetical protein